MFRVIRCSEEIEEPVDFADHISMYVSGGYSLDDILDEEDFEYVFNNTERSSKSFYRVEDRRFTVSKLSKIGQRFSFQGTYGFRSFTRDISVSHSMLDENSDDYAGIYGPVIYKTIGALEHFDVHPYAGGYTVSNQQESLIGGTWKLVDIKSLETSNGEVIPMYIIQQTNPFGTV